jgi:2'-5' RNA ligase
MTVARRATAALIDDLREERLGSIRAAWTFGALALLRSHQGPGGSRYETLSEAEMYAAGQEPGSRTEEGDDPWR